MEPHNRQLWKVANAYSEEYLTHCTYICVVGSVAQKEADEYSDLNLIAFTGKESTLGEYTVVYKEEYVHVQVKSILEFPKGELIKYNPWHFHYLTEAMILKDNNGEFKKLQEWARSYFQSTQGKTDVIEDVKRLVQSRLKFSEKQQKEGASFVATHALLGAWKEAALLYQFISCQHVSMVHLIPFLREKGWLQDTPVPLSMANHLTYEAILDTALRLREHLREEGFSHLTKLTTLQDEVLTKKWERMKESGQWVNAGWLAYHNVFLILMETSQDQPFEVYFSHLPAKMKQRLNDLGFKELDYEQVSLLRHATEELLTTAESTIEQPS
ncbi:hypothetical protein N781_14540 [Pontibacillus halophilus JSM 076056 = DSM 19796]|uniref:Polymerase nucleotidyl transferase domain-containing protein n=2 Tax=Pontibacillus TaxID=289201 RepID=A0A0A5GL85_9BACI|nr:hypothetical protein N781_14540 [Pontibacillus halophilus JSM 076056 = DSM 19796]